MHKYFRRTAVSLSLLLLAFGLRFHKLGHQSFWNDEGNSARLSERPLDKIIEGTASDVHPPLYYLALHGWRELAGDSEFGLRAFSAFAGFLTTAVVIGWTRPFSTPAAGWQTARWLTVSLLTAVSPPLIYYSQESRMYALLGLLAVTSSSVLLRWLRQQNRWSLAAAYILLITAGLYTHYFFPAVIIAHNLIVLWHIAKSDKASTALHFALRWAGMMVAALILYLPWMPIALQQLGRDGTRGNYGQITAVFRWLILGSTSGDGSLATAALPAYALLLFLGIKQRNRTHLSLLLLIPILFIFSIGTTEPQFFKFLVTAVPPSLLLIGLGWEKKRAFLHLFLLLILLAATAVSLNNLYNNPAYARADYRSIAAAITADAHPNAGIILDAPNQWEVFTYYYHDDTPVYPLPVETFPTAAGVDISLREILAQHGRLYVIFWGDTVRDPERLVERWLDEHAFKATERWVNDVRLVMYAVPTEAAAGVETAVNAHFGDGILLDGYTITPERPLAGDVMQLTLFWRAQVGIETRYKVFIHLLNSDGTIIAQRDSEPVGNLKPTDGWHAGEEVVDNHGLYIPADAAAGTYSIRIGLYEAGGGNGRLPIQFNGEQTDTLLIKTITLP